MRLDRNTRFRIRLGLGICSVIFFVLYQLCIVFWFLFWITVVLFVLSGNLLDLLVPLEPDDDT